MTGSEIDDHTLLLNAALDGELDAVGMINVEAKLAADPALAAEYARLVALRNAVRMRAPRPRAPDSLRARAIAISQASSLGQPSRPHRLRLSDPRYRYLAASLMLGVIIGAGGYGTFTSQLAADNDMQRALVAGFVRGQLAAEPVDVATSDRHTVKPWFAGKIAGATTVVDLKADGFPLVGGRVDVVGKTPIATLVYQRREHQIALSEIPRSDGGAPSESLRKSRDGYSLLEWTDEGRLFAAVSDLPPAELEVFAAAFRRAAAAEREDVPKP
jgi:anti-sigma factor RsiW